MTDNTTPAYAMVQMMINDPAGFTIVDKFEAQMNWAAILRFPSMQVAQAWYDSAQYRPYRDLRIKELTNSAGVVFVSGFDPAATAG